MDVLEYFTVFPPTSYANVVDELWWGYTKKRFKGYRGVAELSDSWIQYQACRIAVELGNPALLKDAPLFQYVACCPLGMDAANRMGPPMSPWKDHPSHSAVPYYGHASGTLTTASANPYTLEIATHTSVSHIGGDLFNFKLDKSKQASADQHDSLCKEGTQNKHRVDPIAGPSVSAWSSGVAAAKNGPQNALVQRGAVNEDKTSTNNDREREGAALKRRREGDAPEATSTATDPIRAAKRVRRDASPEEGPHIDPANSVSDAINAGIKRKLAGSPILEQSSRSPKTDISQPDKTVETTLQVPPVALKPPRIVFRTPVVGYPTAPKPGETKIFKRPAVKTFPITGEGYSIRLALADKQ